MFGINTTELLILGPLFVIPLIAGVGLTFYFAFHPKFRKKTS